MDFNVLLKSIQKQFLCCYPLHCISWQDFPRDLTWEQQKLLMDSTIGSSLNEKFPIKISYQYNFLKNLLSILEKHCSEIHDVAYENYCQVQLQLAEDCAQKYAFKHYILSPETHFTIRESKSFVTKGTTGLCSWQASLALADFLIKHPSITREKSVLELGAGTGLCGLIIFKLCQPRHLILTDGSQPCVELMKENLERNFPHAVKESNRFIMDSRMVQCGLVSWESIEDVAKISSEKPDVVIAADVVYDDSCFADLSSAIDFVFKSRHNNVEMFLATTVRNENTLRTFLNIMDSLSFSSADCEIIPENKSNLYWDRSTPVKIFKFTRQ